MQTSTHTHTASEVYLRTVKFLKHDRALRINTISWRGDSADARARARLTFREKMCASVCVCAELIRLYACFASDCGCECVCWWMADCLCAHANLPLSVSLDNKHTAGYFAFRRGGGGSARRWRSNNSTQLHAFGTLERVHTHTHTLRPGRTFRVSLAGWLAVF